MGPAGPVGPTGPQGEPGVPGPGSESTAAVLKRVISDVALTAFTVVTIAGVPASSNNLAHVNKIAGVLTTSVPEGYEVDAVAEGEVTNPSWTWDAGMVLYLNGTTISQTPPTTGFVVKIGQALTTTMIYVHLSESVVL
jgi:hypothetical protein